MSCATGHAPALLTFSARRPGAFSARALVLQPIEKDVRYLSESLTCGQSGWLQEAAGLHTVYRQHYEL
jgi:hypothetical protein